MTLKEWCNQHNTAVTSYDDCMLIADQSRSADAYWHLFHLNDYYVSSIQAGTIWLVAR